MNLNFNPGPQRTIPPNSPYLFGVDQVLAPGTTFVFADVESASICYQPFSIPDSDRAEWWHAPGALHDRGANLSFADAHVEYHVWKAPYNRPMSIQVPDDHPTAPGDPVDVGWLRRRSHHNVRP